MIEREALFYYHDDDLQKLIVMVSVYKFGTVAVPRKIRNKSSISFDGVDDYELYCFRLRDVMLES